MRRLFDFRFSRSAKYIILSSGCLVESVGAFKNMLVQTDKYVTLLTAARVPNAMAEVARIVDLVRGTKGGEFSLPLAVELDDTQSALLETYIEKRAQRVPISRLSERTCFADIEIETGIGVFAPKPEGEALIDHAIMLFKDRGAFRILDLGAGSGCFLLALLHALPETSGLGVDISEAAIALSIQNAAAMGLQGRAEFRLGDWSTGIDEAFDLVISNPPRVATEDLANLMPELREHDPVQSLDGGPDGLKYYRLLAEDFSRITKPGGYGLFQVGPKYVAAAEKIFHSHGFAQTEVKKDFFGWPAGILVRNESDTEHLTH